MAKVVKIAIAAACAAGQGARSARFGTQQLLKGIAHEPPNRLARPVLADYCHTSDPERGNPGYRRDLWMVLGINTAMFVVEIGAGLAAGSASLQADALDFLGDAANYGISLLVAGMASRYRASAAFAKGVSMGAFGLWVIATVIWHAVHGTLPSAVTMGA